MMVYLRTYLCLLLLGITFGCSNSAEVDPRTYEKQAADPANFHHAVQSLTRVIVNDIFSPPAASRVYAYPSIAAYEVMKQAHPQYVSLAGQLHEFAPIPQADTSQTYCFPLAATHAYLKTGKALVFSNERMEGVIRDNIAHFQALGVPKSVMDRSLAYGEQVVDHILAWSDGDNYKQTRGAKHPVSEKTGEWKPTPPGYGEAIEPTWNQLRTFVIDSATQFVPIRPTTYDLDPKSQFYRELMEVYEVGNGLDKEQAAIASFWDCNPYVMNITGHVMFATKKITPGGHWIGITAIACREAEADLMKTTEAYARTAIALADAFISCWDEKYRSNLIRPETVINEHVDPAWQPLLQTPPFPEYTSGHSVISTAAAEALTEIFGEPFAFEDTTELAYGLPSRTYASFRQASAEAAISRLYGGIHYRPAIEEGVVQGKKVGIFINENLTTSQPSAVTSIGTPKSENEPSLAVESRDSALE